MSTSQWFWVDQSGLQQGPVLPAFFLDALRRGQLQTETLVWRDGLAEWVPLHRAAAELGLASYLASSGPPPASATAPQPYAAPHAVQPVAVAAADYGMILLGIPGVATALIWFWVGSMNLLQGPGSSLSLIMWATVFGTASVAAMEASKNGMKSVRAQGTYSPTSWFFIFILLWVVAYPMYLYKRKYYGLKNLLVAGFIAMILFLGSYGMMSAAIDEKVSQIQGSSSP